MKSGMLSAYRSCRLFPTSILHLPVTELGTTLLQHPATRSLLLPFSPVRTAAVTNAVKTTQKSHLPRPADTAPPRDVGSTELGF